MKLNAYISEMTNPYYNLAIEDYLQTIFDSGVTLFLWSNHNTVVIGKHQLAAKECNFALLQDEGGYLARRRSGGGAVFHDIDNLCFTFIYDRRSTVSTFNDKIAYDIIIDALSSFGIKASKTGRNDIEVDGKKVSGNAYYIQGNTKVHHGTLLIDTNIEKMQRYLLVEREKLSGHGVSSVRSRVANLKEFCPLVNKENLSKEIVGSAEKILCEKANFISEDKAFCEQRKRELCSYDYLYSFEVYDCALSKRFVWGSADITFSVKKGVISSFALYTDCMDNAKAEETCRKMIGINLYTVQKTNNKMLDDLIALCQDKIFD